ncbi:HD domain-containing protein [Gracilinema caldarium]|uniref:Metal dependent phosphohydrolase n=1 Tax=Gracilinema caldarium (strain ATCC 51460 / DSM 7334 / H1) TaxID=744872 RepID=F8EZ04_GRAC1|nr:metal dependent phosphohydrolase [Gracilinema caldarium DSM 7334]
MLQSGFTEPFRDNIWGHIYMTPAIAALCRSASFNRLHHIRQLGPTYLVYPGATHSRAAHSIGVYHIAKKMIYILLERGADAFISSEGLFSFLCAALLHDIGHFPYTHSLKDLPLEEHEVLTGKLILSEELKFLIGHTGADPYMTAAIVDHKLPIHGSEEILFYRHLLSGVLDPDKLDYLNRDAHHCGVPYGNQDIDFTLSRLYPDKKQGLSIDTKGIANIEAILFSKYLMYRSVYWHREVRSATVMMKKCIRTSLAAGFLHPEDLYNLDDTGLFTRLACVNHSSAQLAALVQEGHIWPSILEFPLEIDKIAQKLDWETRDFMEQRVAELLSSVTGIPVSVNQLIIDIPEPISFETNLALHESEKPFLTGPTVFSTNTMENFARVLRVIRIFTEPDVYKALKNNLSKVTEVLRNTETWLHL